MKRPNLELAAIMQGPCEACHADTWTYRVIETHTAICFSQIFRWCEECVLRHAQEHCDSIYDRLTDKVISFGGKKRAVV